MKKKRYLLVLSVLVFILGLAAVSLVAAQSDGREPDADGQTAREIEKASAAERGTLDRSRDPRSLSSGQIPTSDQLFAGVDDAAVPGYFIDVDTGVAAPIFTGLDVWGAAYDPDGEQLYLSGGSDLWYWPLDSADPPVLIDTITGAVSGATLVMEGLAYHDGTLYGSRVGNSVADPEGIYTIDPATAQATLYIQFQTTAGQTLSGIDADPDTGTLYGTNDASTNRGLVEINLDGTVTQIAPYPGTESDVDGLGVGGGYAYLVIDQAGDIYVYDFTAGAYVTPLPSPFTTSEVFSGGAYVPGEPGISLRKTVGTDPGVCAATSNITVPEGTAVTYCYEVTNTTTQTLSLHDLTDSQLGDILDGYAFDLGPGASTFVTQTTTPAASVTNDALWTAYNPGPIDVYTDTASATVLVAAPEPLVCNGTPVQFEVGIPPDWTVIDLTGGPGIDWVTTADPACEQPNLTDGTGEAACADSDAAGSGAPPYDTVLESPPFSIPAGNAALLSAAAYYNDLNLGANDRFEVDVWDGSAWNNLLSWDEDHLGEDLSVSLSAYAGTSDLKVRFRYLGDGFDWYAQVDDVQLSCLDGTVAVDLNKTVGTDPGVCATTDTIDVEAGTDVYYCYEITNTGTTTLDTHDLIDDQLGDILSGLSHTLAPGDSVSTVDLGLTISTTINSSVTNSATWTGWSGAFSNSDTDTATVNALFPDIDLQPDSLSSDQPPDSQVTLPLQVRNVGDGTLNWSIDETQETGAPLAANSQQTGPQRAEAQAPVVRSAKECAQYANYAGAEPEGYATYCVGSVPQPSGQAMSGPTDIAYAQDIGFVSDNFVSHELGDFPGQTVLGSSTLAIYAYDFDWTGTTLYAILNSTAELGTIDLNTGAFTALMPTTLPAGNTISGLTIDPSTNQAYASVIVGSVGSIYSLDLATGAATLIGGDSEVPFLIDIAIGPQGVMYGHDISTDSIYTIDLTTGDATLVGPTGVNSNFAQGMDFDNTDGTLYAYTYQGGGANQYGTIDLATGALTPLAVDNPLGEFEGATKTSASACATPVDVPWLSLDPSSGTTPSGGSTDVDVTFDSAGLSTGIYTATLCVNSNDPDEALVTVPLTLTVSAQQDLIFADDFNGGDLSAWTLAQTDNGDLAATTAAAIEGSHGMEAVIDDAARLFVADDTPSSESRYRARFLFDPNSLPMNTGQRFVIFVAGDFTTAQLAGSRPPVPVLAVEFGRAGGNYGVRGIVRDDNGAVSTTSPALINNGPNMIEIDWQASAPGASDGHFTLYVNDTEVSTVSGLDNDGQRIELAALGVPLGPVASGPGSLYFDLFESRRLTYIGLP